MAQVVYIPLDERPVNLQFPQAIAAESPHIQFIVPPRDLLGLKKEPASLEQLWAWLDKALENADYLIGSLDMLLYGGIVPSRLHHFTAEQCEEKLSQLKKLKQRYPQLKMYLFNLIMRVPSYNSSDEEPDYYDRYGEKIFRLGWLMDKQQRELATSEESTELEEIKRAIPPTVHNDYLNRRAINHFVNQQAIQLVDEDVIDFLVIPLDDCAEFGFSVSEQRQLLEIIDRKTLHNKVHVYPGGDDVGCTLTARVFNELVGARPRVFVRYSSVFGPTIIPRYEDRPLGESIKSQITVCGGVVVESEDCDMVLMVNSPTLSGIRMPDAAQAAVERDISYYSFRNLREFVNALRYYIELGKPVALGDVAFGNGSDDELMRILVQAGLLNKLLSYAGWNTPGNTLGTVIAHSMIRLSTGELSKEESRPNKFVLDRFVEDWGYQTRIRSYLTERGSELGISYFDLYDKQDKVAAIAHQKLNEFAAEYLRDFAPEYHISEVFFPWNRLFEIGLISEFEEH